MGVAHATGSRRLRNCPDGVRGSTSAGGRGDGDPRRPLPAEAAPVITGGLVNVTVTDVLSGNQVTAQVPITVAANVCDVSVAVLAQDLRDGTADCSNDQQIITVSRTRR